MSLVDRRLLGLSSAEGPSSELVVGLNVNANCIMSIRTERPEEKKKCTCSAERPAVSTVSMAAFHFTWKQTAPGLTLPNSLSLTPVSLSCLFSPPARHLGPEMACADCYL